MQIIYLRTSCVTLTTMSCGQMNKGLVYSHSLVLETVKFKLTYYTVKFP